MGELFAEFGDLVFTLVISYISAIEFMYVVRHLYHYSFNHDANSGIDESENMSQLQDSMRQQLANAKNKEDVAGTQLMKDGVPYKDGFRLEAQQALIDQLKEQLKDKELSDLRRQELEKELAKQKKIAEKLRKELAEAEEKYQRKLKEEEKAKTKKLLEEQKLREQEERAKKEAEEQARKLAEAEQRKREEEERHKKEEEQKYNERKQREEEERKEAEEQARRLTEAEKQREAEQRQREEVEKQRELELRKREEEERKEAEEQARRLAEAEKQREADQRKREEAEKQRELELRKRAEEERKEEEEQARLLVEAEKQREVEQRQREEVEKQREAELRKREEEERKEAEEQARRLAEAEKQREAEQRQREEAEENDRKLQKEINQRQIEQRKLEEELEEAEVRREQEMAEAEENTRLLIDLEKAHEKEQAEEEEEAEAELATKNLLAIEHRLEEQLRAAEKEAELTEKEHQLINSIKKRDFNVEEGNEHKEAELLRKILQAREQLGEESEEEQTLRLIQRERDQESKQKRIEENALLFMEAEKEMAELQSNMLDAIEKRQYSGNLDSIPNTPVVEEPCIKRSFSPLLSGESSHSTVKTQLAQDLDKPYSVRTKPLLFPGVSDDASSVDPASSQQSSFSTQPSEEITTGTDSQYLPQERQEPDGEDTALNNMQYSDDYLRSLDGIKQRPLVREDGSGRRRAFKKRRSSNSSNSSRESRHSRDEELKMFTSLEEEEMKDNADSEFTPIRYTTEPTLKVKGHHRRHKRSPAKDIRRGDDSLRSSLERLGEETSDPWGELKPEHYKNSEFWKKEKTVSIEEEMEFEKPASSEEVLYDTATNMPSASSFEEATQKQNQQALTTLQKHSAKGDAQEAKLDDQAVAKEESARSDNTNLQTSEKAEKNASPPRFSASPRLRRSPNIEEIDQYNEHLKESKDVADKSEFSTAQNTPTINVEAPLDFGPWRDEYGLIMEGLSDFYDFTASVNPSRSRSASRNVSPANSAPTTPHPKNVSFETKISSEKINEKTTTEIYDDTDNLESNEFRKENIIKFLDSLNDNKDNVKETEKESEVGIEEETEVGIKNHLQFVADDPLKSSSDQARLVPLVNIIDEDDTSTSPNLEDSLVSNLRSQQTDRSHSRSKSPLPTPDNLKRSVENRRYKMIKHNEDVLEKLIESKLLPEIVSPEEIEDNSSTEKTLTTKLNLGADNDNNSQEQTNCLVQSLHIEKRRSRSKSPMRLPTAENLSKGLEKRRSKLIERNDEIIKQLEESSQTPESPTLVVENIYEIESSEETVNTTAISIDSSQNEQSFSPTEEDDNFSREEMNLLVQSLREARSKTRSKTPMRVKEDFNETSGSKIFYGFSQTEYAETNQQLKSLNIPSISIGFSETETESKILANVEDVDDDSRENMDLLVQSLRLARSRSTSKSPMRLLTDKLMQHVEETPEPAASSVEYGQRSRHSRSRSPSRSHSISPTAYRSNTPSRSLSPQLSYHEDFNVILNLEGSKNRTLSISTEEQESLHLANRQRQLDEEALERLRNASEEMELRTLSPLILDRDELNEQQSQDYLAELPITERTKRLRNSPTTPDYDRTISEEMRDVARIKQERLQKGFKRSTYVGESMDLGSEYESLRKEAANFQRSRSPSPSFSTVESMTAQIAAEEKRKIQDLILQELTTNTNNEDKNTGAIPKTDRLYNEMENTKRNKEEMLNSSFESSTYTEYSEYNSESFEELRRSNAEFKRSASTSRSPFRESQLEIRELSSIKDEGDKVVFKDKFLDEVSCSTLSFRDFSRHLNTECFDNNRRSSDSALIKAPDIVVQLNLDVVDLDPEEYHHYRRFSLAQEEPTEQYPGDDYIFIQQVEVRTRSGSRTWLREDFYSENVEEFLAKGEKSQNNSAERETTQPPGDELPSSNDYQEEENVLGAEDEEEYSNASDDDRQTVVEVDDEIDEDISDFNDRGPAEESHHETSECEEAEREMDRYAGREASDWNQVVNVDDIIIGENRAYEMVNTEEDEGAVGGLSNSPYDSDSFAIDQIYDEAIKNRKQSGILREYDSILRQMSTSSDIDEQYLLWSKTNGKKNPKNVEFNTQFLENERKDSEMRYLGDSNTTARQSARLRSRYGYNPVLQAKCIEDDFQVDLNYKPKREYNWRRNFKLDEDNVKEDKEITWEEIYAREEQNDNRPEEQWGEIYDNEEKARMIDEHKFSLDGESVTLFSRSPERLEDKCEADEQLIIETLAKVEAEEGKLEKPKKKKTKKKSHKESKASLEETMNREDEDAYDNQVNSRRSSSMQMDTDSPKRKSRSRRSSKSSLINEDSLGLFSPRSSIAYNETAIVEEFTEVSKETSRPKKMKKRKKVKETMANVAESPVENKEDLIYTIEPVNHIPAVSAVVTPESSSANILSNLSPQNSVCVTPASIDTDLNLSVEELRENYNETATTSSSATPVSPSENLSRTSSITTTTQADTFDILKDANFYPLF